MKGVFGHLDFTYNPKKFMHNAVFFMTLLMLSLICLFALKNAKGQDIEYTPQQSYYQYQQYRMQFSAFLSGQIPLNTVPTEKLAALENPYDPMQRAKAGIEATWNETENSYLWDIAYYNGQYYSYFGIAPILTVYYPYYAVTGMIPSVRAVCLLLGIFAVLMTGLAYREFVMRFCENPNLWLMTIGLVGVVWASGVFVSISYSDNYYIAVASALGQSMAFLFLGFRAMRTESTVTRSVFLALSAIALTLTVWSRPTVALMCLVILPVFLGFACRIRRKTVKGDLISIASFLVPLSIGASAVMWYNAVRFGSPFEFGSVYQLTVSDISANTVSLSLLKASLVTYFLQFPASAGDFPFLKTSYFNMVDGATRYVYCAENIGALHYGLPLGALACPFFLQFKREPVKSFSYLLIIILSVSIAFLDFCVAGICLRYLFDFLPILSILGISVLLNAQSKTSGSGKGILSFVIVFLCAMAVLVMLGVLRSNARDLLFFAKGV